MPPLETSWRNPEAWAVAEEIAYRWNLEAKVPRPPSARAGVVRIFEDTKIGWYRMRFAVQKNHQSSQLETEKGMMQGLPHVIYSRFKKMRGCFDPVRFSQLYTKDQFWHPGAWNHVAGAFIQLPQGFQDVFGKTDKTDSFKNLSAYHILTSCLMANSWVKQVFSRDFKSLFALKVEAVYHEAPARYLRLDRPTIGGNCLYRNSGALCAIFLCKYYISGIGLQTWASDVGCTML